MEPELLLSKSTFFSALREDHRKALADICVPKSLKKKDILFMEGDKGSAIYLCARGRVQLYKTSPDGQEVVIKVIQPGDLFAEVVLFEKNVYPVTAIALEESRVYLLSKIQFDCLLQDVDFRHDFIANLMSKMRYLTEQVQYLTAYDVEARFFRFLKEQYDGQSEMKITLSKKDIAATIGATPETFSRLIQRLVSEGRIKWSGKVVRILGTQES